MHGSLLTAMLAMVITMILAAHPSQAAPNDIQGLTIGQYQQEFNQTYASSDGLPCDDILAVTVHNNKTFAATTNGLAAFDGHTWTTILNQEPVTLLLPNGENLVALSANRLIQINPSGDIVTLTDILASPVQAIASHGSRFWLGTENGLYVLDNGTLTPDNSLAQLAGNTPAIRSLACASDGRLAAAADTGLFLREQNQWRRLFPKTGTYSWAAEDTRAVLFDPNGSLWFSSPQGVGRMSTDGIWSLATGLEGLPWNGFTKAIAAHGDSMWFGTDLGAIRLDAKADLPLSESRWHYRQGPRWLPDDHIRDIALDNNGNAWCATASGIGLIAQKTFTLAEKAAFIEDIIDKRHRRTPYGFVLACSLKNPGDLSSWSNHDSDNDGLWTGMYGAAECFAYAATKDPKARDRAKAAFEALKFLNDVTQGGEKTVQKGFPARSILPTDGPNPNDSHSIEEDIKRQENDPLWKVLHPRWPRSADGKWFWKCDTSSDELDGHYFLNALYHDLVADTPEEKARVAQVVCDTTDHLMNNDYNLVDWDGKPTRWAYFGPQELNHNPDRWQERGMNSLGILAYLAVAEHMSGNPKYREARRELVEKHSYAINAYVSTKMHMGPGTGNQSDDEMTIMRFYLILLYESDQSVRNLMEFAFWQYWNLVRREHNPFFNFLYAASFSPNSRSFWNQSYEPTGNWLQESADVLTGWPINLINWPMQNSHRLDILAHHEHPYSRSNTPSHGYTRNGGVIPIQNRWVEHWSADVWSLDHNGDGRSESDGAAYLLAYYSGRFFGFINN